MGVLVVAVQKAGLMLGICIKPVVPKRLSDELDAGRSIGHEDDIKLVRLRFEEAKDTCTDILYSVGGEL